MEAQNTPTPPKPPKASSGKTHKSVDTGAIPPMINPAWAAFIIRQHDLVGNTAERATVALSEYIEKQVLKATKPEKLHKLVMASIQESYRKARG